MSTGTQQQADRGRFYEVLRFVLGTCLDLFYSRTTLGGRVPGQGPILLVANHPNGLVDPMLVGVLAPERQVRFLAKAPIFRMPVLGALVRAARALPVYRPSDSPGEQDKNEQTFTACFEALAQGSAICIFPEGVSHSLPSLQKMKTGAARIALGAEARHGFGLGVRVVPVGLTYRDKHLFRGKVAAEIGEPLPVAHHAELYARDPRAATDALTSEIGEALERVTLNVERWEDLPALEAAERLYASGKRLELGAAERQARLRRFAEGLRELRRDDPQSVEQLRHHIEAFAARLRALGATPEDLDVHYTPANVARFAVHNLAALLLGLPLAALGTLFWLPPYQMPRLVVTLTRPELDIEASTKLGVSLLVFPLWYAAAVLAAGIWLGGAVALAAALLLPLAGWYAVVFRERREEALEDAAVFFRLGLRQAQRQHLLARRAELVAAIDELAAGLAR